MRRTTARTATQLVQAMDITADQFARAHAAGLVPDPEMKTRWSGPVVDDLVARRQEILDAILDDLDEQQLREALGMSWDDWKRALEADPIPAPDRGDYWTRPAADALIAQAGRLRAEIPPQPLGATRCAALLARATGVKVDVADVQALAELGHTEIVDWYGKWPLYDVGRLHALIATEQGRRLVVDVVAERTAWLAGSLTAEQAAAALGWRETELARVAAERGIARGRFDRYSRTDIVALSGDQHPKVVRSPPSACSAPGDRCCSAAPNLAGSRADANGHPSLLFVKASSPRSSGGPADGMPRGVGGEPCSVTERLEVIGMSGVGGQLRPDAACGNVDPVVAEPFLPILVLAHQGDDGYVRGEVAATPLQEHLVRIMAEVPDLQRHRHLAAGVEVKGYVSLSVIDRHELLPVGRQIDQNPVHPRIADGSQPSVGQGGPVDDRAVLALANVQEDMPVARMPVLPATVPDGLQIRLSHYRSAFGVEHGPLVRPASVGHDIWPIDPYSAVVQRQNTSWLVPVPLMRERVERGPPPLVSRTRHANDPVQRRVDSPTKIHRRGMLDDVISRARCEDHGRRQDTQRGRCQVIDADLPADEPRDDLQGARGLNHAGRLAPSRTFKKPWHPQWVNAPPMDDHVAVEVCA
ncbi:MULTISPECIES: hypothetical protein [Streptosporangium]|uniref:DUF222 domain-containing protein n=1 Tax=Streptosporangium brasiliense TaxID=47480 RepID=A0ABT9RH70_9ACTN|nr:hypothetical protein [Streptosporangium brasiliense]MDP9868604.1 hypothetical protein [Streptosporangium brasiliense]